KRSSTSVFTAHFRQDFSAILGKTCFNSSFQLSSHGLSKCRRMALPHTDATQSSFAPHNGSHSQTEGAPAPPWHRADPPCQRPRNSDSREGCFSSLCPTAFGRPRWDRATARNCGRRIAGCDAHPAESEEVSALVLCEQHS